MIHPTAPTRPQLRAHSRVIWASCFHNKTSCHFLLQLHLDPPPPPLPGKGTTYPLAGQLATSCLLLSRVASTFSRQPQGMPQRTPTLEFLKEPRAPQTGARTPQVKGPCQAPQKGGAGPPFSCICTGGWKGTWLWGSRRLRLSCVQVPILACPPTPLPSPSLPFPWQRSKWKRSPEKDIRG